MIETKTKTKKYQKKIGPGTEIRSGGYNISGFDPWRLFKFVKNTGK